MSGRRHRGIFLAFVCAVGLLSASIAAILTAERDNRAQFQLLGSVCRDIMEEQPGMEKTVLSVLKAHKDNLTGAFAGAAGENILAEFGYEESDFRVRTQKTALAIAGTGFLTGVFLLALAVWHLHKREIARIEALTEYLEQVNTGGPALLPGQTDDPFCKLQDEIYKTVTFACQTRDAALEARQNFAENLSNIAHQLKTPITAISLSAQLLKGDGAEEQAGQIKRQLDRLTHLEEALLLLSRLDAGTLPLDQKEVDVFTLLTLAADNLQEVFAGAGVSVDIPELGEIWMKADLEWTMEAVMNLMKNCMEHTPRGGAVHCSYDQNPLYARIRIWDEGKGFDKADIPHLFERFYRGRNAAEGGIGIGLSLAKSILERQNGTISAGNLPDGGACFEIRVYSH